jgi:hypothetical protein
VCKRLGDGKAVFTPPTPIKDDISALSVSFFIYGQDSGKQKHKGRIISSQFTLFIGWKDSKAGRATPQLFLFKEPPIF